MILVDLITRETGTPLERIMLLRHSNQIVDSLLRKGGSIENYTFMQPVGSKYDYYDPTKPRIEIVVVIVHDAVYGVFKVLGVEQEGTTYMLAGEAHRSFDIERSVPDRPAKLFRMEPIQSAALGRQVIGWESRTRTPVQRFDGSFFRAIEVALPDAPMPEATLRKQLEMEVKASFSKDSNERQRRLVTAPKLPPRVETVSVSFMRNADVIAEVLTRAAGKCEDCNSPAPFRRSSDGTPYLEVHHKIRLADNGEDTVENAIAICPNCHRRAHYGV